jgi:hypothetical protein
MKLIESLIEFKTGGRVVGPVRAIEIEIYELD